MSRRIGLSTLSALVALVVTVVVFARTPGAVATQGQPIVAGQVNTETSETVVENTNVAVVGCNPASNSGLLGCGVDGVEGFGTTIGVRGRSPGTAILGQHTSTSGVGVQGQTEGVGSGVYGLAEEAGVGVVGESKDGIGVQAKSATSTGLHSVGGPGKTGVFGTHEASVGIGVHGQSGGIGSAVYGENTGPGVGVFGDTTNGTGVQARSTNGNALRVLGKAQFSRSGRVTIPAGSTSVVVPGVALTASSMVPCHNAEHPGEHMDEGGGAQRQRRHHHDLPQQAGPAGRERGVVGDRVAVGCERRAVMTK